MRRGANEGEGKRQETFFTFLQHEDEVKKGKEQEGAQQEGFQLEIRGRREKSERKGKKCRTRARRVGARHTEESEGGRERE